MELPHVNFIADQTIDEILESLAEVSYEDGGVLLAQSQEFRGTQPKIAEVYPAYRDFFKQKGKEISKILGQPYYEGVPPKDQEADEMIVWKVNEEKIYLKIFHIDQELPIEVSLECSSW